MLEETKIEDYCIVFTGVFHFTHEERELIKKRSIYDPLVLEDTIKGIVKTQYYPVFRHLITNDSEREELFFELTGNSEYQCEKQSLCENTKFAINNVKLSFFRQETGLGLFSFSVSIVGEQNVDMLIQFCRELREFKTEILYSGKVYSVFEFVEKNILRLFDSPSIDRKLRISEVASGSKLKTYVAVALSDIASEYSRYEALYEIGTFTKYGTSKNQIGLYSPSGTYFSNALGNNISVFDNWTALAFMDSFVIVGNKEFLRVAKPTILGSYFKIYVFNLYCKFYLFKLNSDIEDCNRRLDKNELYGFLKRYDLTHISYNFLPNLIHLKIRQALEIEAETLSLKNKIELIDNIRIENHNKVLNSILFFVSILSVISVLADFPELMSRVFGKKLSEEDESSYTFFGLGCVFFFAILFFGKYYWGRKKIK